MNALIIALLVLVPLILGGHTGRLSDQVRNSTRNQSPTSADVVAFSLEEKNKS